jgi:predicted transcriptional regulator
MTLSVTISDELAGRLQSVAKAMAQTPEQVAVAAIERDLSPLKRLEEVLDPVRAAFEASGLTENELTELLEAEKHAMRRERRSADAQ